MSSFYASCSLLATDRYSTERGVCSHFGHTKKTNVLNLFFFLLLQNIELFYHYSWWNSSTFSKYVGCLNKDNRWNQQCGLWDLKTFKLHLQISPSTTCLLAMIYWFFIWLFYFLLLCFFLASYDLPSLHLYSIHSCSDQHGNHNREDVDRQLYNIPNDCKCSPLHTYMCVHILTYTFSHWCYIWALSLFNL